MRVSLLSLCPCVRFHEGVGAGADVGVRVARSRCENEKNICMDFRVSASLSRCLRLGGYVVCSSEIGWYEVKKNSVVERIGLDCNVL